MNVGKGPTILVVEDDRDVLAATRLRLQAAGYETIGAGDGRIGVDLAIEHRPDVILMDVRMPEMDGLSALDTLSSNSTTDGIPVIMVSASLLDQETALDRGARFFLSKPFRSPDLLSAVRAATNSI